MSSILKGICFFSFMMCAQVLQAQFKYEREYRLKDTAVPTEAKVFINADLPLKQLKWYYEEGLKDNSIEAKFKLQKKKYSVEFDTLGKLQDIEILISKQEIPLIILNEINTKLDTDFDRFKFRRIQLQYLGETLTMSHFYPAIDPPEQIKKNYELVIKGRQNGVTKLYEYLFNAKGELLRINEILLRNTDNLEY